MISSSWKPLSGRSKSTVFVAHLGRGVHRLQKPVARCHGASNFHFCRASPSFLLAVWSPHPSPAASSTCSTIPCMVDSKNPACKADATSGAHQSAAVAERGRQAGPRRGVAPLCNRICTPLCTTVRTASCVHPHLVLRGWELRVLELDIPHDNCRKLCSVSTVDIHAESSPLANEVAFGTKPPELLRVSRHPFRLHRNRCPFLGA